MDLGSGMGVHSFAGFACIILFYLLRISFAVCIVSNDVTLFNMTLFNMIGFGKCTFQDMVQGR